MNNLKENIRHTTIANYIDKYNVEVINGTMIINKKIPVADFIRLRENIRKLKQIDNIIVDADYNPSKKDIVGIL